VKKCEKVSNSTVVGDGDDEVNILNFQKKNEEKRAVLVSEEPDNT